MSKENEGYRSAVKGQWETKGYKFIQQLKESLDMAVGALESFGMEPDVLAKDMALIEKVREWENSLRTAQRGSLGVAAGNRPACEGCGKETEFVDDCGGVKCVQCRDCKRLWPLSYSHRGVAESKADSLFKYYNKMLPEIRRASRENGYAIAVHGSMQRDLDLVAVPWRECAVLPSTLAQRIAEVADAKIFIDAFVITPCHDLYRYCYHIITNRYEQNDSQKASGYIELSVTPKNKIK